MNGHIPPCSDRSREPSADRRHSPVHWQCCSYSLSTLVLGYERTASARRNTAERIGRGEERHVNPHRRFGPTGFQNSRECEIELIKGMEDVRVDRGGGLGASGAPRRAGLGAKVRCSARRPPAALFAGGCRAADQSGSAKTNRLFAVPARASGVSDARLSVFGVPPVLTATY